MNFITGHPKSTVFTNFYILFYQGFIETGPAGSAFKLIFAGKKLKFATDA
jgi:hypothetical protein